MCGQCDPDFMPVPYPGTAYYTWPRSSALTMSTYLMIPGAGGAGWYWHRVVPLLEAAGHQAIAVDLPGPDPAAGLPEYTDIAVAAAQGRDDVVLVAGSLGGFTAPLAAERIP